jgi:hypothetical protein
VPQIYADQPFADRYESVAWLEIKLQRELNEPWIARRLVLSKLRRSQFDSDRLDLSSRSDRSPERIRVIEYVEEVSTELDPHLLLYRE